MNFAVIDKLCDLSKSARTLLKATYNFLQNVDDKTLSLTTNYDGTEFDGYSLKENIKDWLNEYEA